ncbi:uncharacterized protein LOC111018384 [Momordica charantia]|uniref:Uncharacterized protein LOC111018384 n=1 Tax=Momordica charantia TaxID=3673 RepID=A0A6J1D7M4_MOMCH|nr:uncharacterized protein LOC111018384 [Momordica charantia]
MEGDKDAYYVVQKGGVVGFYKSLKEYEAQPGCSIFDPNATIYKGYHLSKEAEQYLASHGLQSATYSISAANVTEDLFGKLLACTYEQPSSYRGQTTEERSANRPHQVHGANEYGFVGANWVSTDSPKQEIIWDHGFEAVPASSSCKLSASRGKMAEGYSGAKRPHQHETVECKLSASRGKMAEGYSGAKRPHQHETVECDFIGGSYWTSTPLPDIGFIASAPSSNCVNSQTYFLEFDGASKGNPGLAGAGAVLRAKDGSTVCRLQEGVGIATNNVAEYRAVILGLKHALKNGFKHIRVQGDSKLVCMQVQGLWKIKNPNMGQLCKVAKELKDKFASFEISHIPREQNSDADALANRAIHLRDGVVVEDCKHK